MTTVTNLKAIRVTHNYIGVFFAPTILFFAMTGGLQMFGLHETSRGSTYAPPAFLVHLAQLHKKGTLYLPVRKAPVKADAPKPDAAKADVPKADAQKTDAPKAATPSPLPIKIFFGATALALLISTITGLLMAWKYVRRKGLVVGVFLAGVVCPLLLLLL